MPPTRRSRPMSASTRMTGPADRKLKTDTAARMLRDAAVQDEKIQRLRTTQPLPNEADTDPNDRYAATTWGSSSDGLEDLTVPSGQLCLVRRPGVQGLIQAGVLHDMDSLTAIVEDKHVGRAAGKKSVDVRALLQNTAALDNVMRLADRIICYVVVKPTVVMPPDDVTLRRQGVIYADMVDIEDKMFIVNYAVGGTRSLERFRGELQDVIRDVVPGEDLSLPSE